MGRLGLMGIIATVQSLKLQKSIENKFNVLQMSV